MQAKLSSPELSTSANALQAQCIWATHIQHAHELVACCGHAPVQLRGDPSHRDAVSIQGLATLLLDDVGQCSLQRSGRALGQGGTVLLVLIDTMSSSFRSMQFDALILNKRIKGSTANSANLSRAILSSADLSEVVSKPSRVHPTGL